MRKRSLSLFQPVDNSTALKLEGISECDDDDDLFWGELKVDDDYAEKVGEVILPEYVINDNENKLRDKLNNDIEFIKALKLVASDEDRRSYRCTVKYLKYNKVDRLKGMNENEFRAKFSALLKSIGRFRTFYSVVHDMEKFYIKAIKKKNYPKKPQHPRTVQTIFMKELLANGKTPPANQNIFKWTTEMYNNLSMESRSQYIKKREQMILNYSHQLEEYYKMYPNERPRNLKQITPFNLYFDELKSTDKNCKRTTALGQWKILPVKNKVGYIKKAYQYQQDEASDDKKITITNKEKILLHKHYGKPEKPPLNAYRLYLQDLLNMPHKYQTESYKNLTIEVKEQLQNRLNGMIQKYKEDMTDYIKQFKGEAKKTEEKELLKILSKYRLPETSIDNSNRSKRGLKRNSSVQHIDSANNEGEKVKSNKKKKLMSEPEINYKDIKPTYQNGVNTRQKSKQKHLDDIKPKTDVTEFLEIKPPRTVFKYFVSINSFDSLQTARNVYNSFSVLKKKKIKKTYKLVCDTYLNKLRQYLSSLNELEIQEFVHQMEQNKSLANNTDNEMTCSDDESSTDDESSSDSE